MPSGLASLRETVNHGTCAASMAVGTTWVSRVPVFSRYFELDNKERYTKVYTLMDYSRALRKKHDWYRSSSRARPRPGQVH